MADQIGADFGRLATTQQHLAQTASSMNSTLSDLKAFIKPLVGTWQGEASTQYQVLQAKWDSAATDLNTVLSRISAALAEANTQFQATERANAARF
jgi:early secretory antigenic target protein ESAT-6